MYARMYDLNQLGNYMVRVPDKWVVIQGPRGFIIYDRLPSTNNVPLVVRNIDHVVLIPVEIHDGDKVYPYYWAMSIRKLMQCPYYTVIPVDHQHPELQSALREIGLSPAQTA